MSLMEVASYPLRQKRKSAFRATSSMSNSRGLAMGSLNSLLRSTFLDAFGRLSLTAAFPGRKLHVILDNLNTHKKNEDWLKAHPNVQFHFTPTSASWLNQVEVWFSILQGQSLRSSPREVCAAVPRR